MEHSLSRIMHFAVLAIAVLPLALLPIQGSSASVHAGMYISLVLAVLAVASGYVISRKPQRFEIPRGALPISGLPLACVALVSVALHGPSLSSFVGYDIAVTTVAAISLYALTILIGSCAPPSTARTALALFAGVTALCGALAALLQFVIPDELRSVALLDAWPELSLLAAAAVIITAYILDTSRRAASRGWYGALGAANLLLLIIYPYGPAFALLACYAPLVLGYGLMRRKIFTGVPFALLAVSLCGAALFFFGSRVPLVSVPVDSVPSHAATERIVASAYSENPLTALIGVGPNRVSLAWDRYRDQSFNVGPLWDATVERAASTLLTFALTLGMLGVLALLLAPFLVFRHIWHRRGSLAGGGVETRPDPDLAPSLLALVLFSALCIYPCGPTTFFLTALAFGLSARTLSPSAITVTISSRWYRAISAIALVIGAALLIWALNMYGISQRDAARGAALFDAGAYETAAPLLGHAADRLPLPEYRVAASRAYLAWANTIPASDPLSAPLIAQAVRYADLGFADSMNSYPLTIHRASLYVSLLHDGYPDAAERARSSINAALLAAPYRPEARYEQARFLLAEGDRTEALTALQEALRLKPDYRAVYELLQEQPSDAQ